MINIDSTSSLPIFEQIVQEIGRLIAYQILNPHDQLPSVRSLAKDLGINPNTVMKAYSLGEKQDLIYSKSGLGFFVSEASQGLDNLLDKSYQDLFAIVKSIIQLGDSIDTIQNKIKEEFQ